MRVLHLLFENRSARGVRHQVEFLAEEVLVDANDGLLPIPIRSQVLGAKPIPLDEPCYPIARRQIVVSLTLETFI